MPEADTTRDVVAAAYKDAVAKAESAPAPEPATEAAPEPAGEPSGDAAPKSPAGAPAPSGERARDGNGRFIVPPKVKEGKPAVPDGKAPASAAPLPPAKGDAAAVPGGAPAAAPPALPELKAPQDWRLTAREKWASLPREVQEEALRLHVETKKTLSEAAEVRKNWQAYQEAVGPHEQFIRQRGYEPAKAVGALLNREVALMNGPPEVKADLLADGIAAYLGTTDQAIDLLAAALKRKQEGQAQQQAQQRYIDPNQIAAQAEQRVVQRIMQAQAQRTQQEADEEVATFEQTHEFLGDHEYAPRLTRIMSTLLLDAAEERHPMSVEDAYNEALQLHPETRKIVQQREAAKAATAKAATTQAARAASSSIKSEPAGPAANGKPKSDRELVAQAYYAAKRAAQ